MTDYARAMHAANDAAQQALDNMLAARAARYTSDAANKAYLQSVAEYDLREAEAWDAALRVVQSQRGN